MAANKGDLERELVSGGLSAKQAAIIANAIANANSPGFSQARDTADTTPTDKLRLVTSDTRRYQLTNLDYGATAPFRDRLSDPKGKIDPPPADHPYTDSQPVVSAPPLSSPPIVGSDHIDVEQAVDGNVATSTIALKFRFRNGQHLRLDDATKSLDAVSMSAVSDSPDLLSAQWIERESSTELKVTLRGLQTNSVTLDDGSSMPILSWATGLATAAAVFTSWAKTNLLQAGSAAAARTNLELGGGIMKARVTFTGGDGSTGADLTPVDSTAATYTRSGTTTTITLANHGYRVGQFVYLTGFSGASPPAAGVYAIASIVSDNAFTITTASGTVGGNVTRYTRPILSSYNVHSVAPTPNRGENYVNFLSDLSSATYLMVGSTKYASDNVLTSSVNVQISRRQSPSSPQIYGCAVMTTLQTTAYNCQYVCVGFIE